MPKPKTISKEVPLAEITLRKYEKPADLSARELVRKLCLSIGLLQPGDSRDVIVDVFHVIIKSKKDLNKKRKEIELIENDIKKLKNQQNILSSRKSEDNNVNEIYNIDDKIQEIYKRVDEINRTIRNLTSDDICHLVIEERKSLKLPMLGIASSNIRRQLKRLKDLLIVEKRLNAYRITEHGHLAELFEEKIEKFLLPAITARIKDYLKKIEEMQ